MLLGAPIFSALALKELLNSVLEGSKGIPRERHPENALKLPEKYPEKTLMISRVENLDGRNRAIVIAESLAASESYRSHSNR